MLIPLQRFLLLDAMSTRGGLLSLQIPHDNAISILILQRHRSVMTDEDEDKEEQEGIPFPV